MNLNRQDKLDIFETAISWIVVMGMLVYGLGKIIQFEDATDLNKTLGELTGMQLMWAFYSYSKPFVYTLAVLEVLGGILLLIRKTRLFGCFLSSIILVNVILQDIFYGVHLGALKAAIFYQILILVLFYLHKEAVFKSIKQLILQAAVQQSKLNLFIKLTIAFVVFILLRTLEYYLTIG